MDNISLILSGLLSAAFLLLLAPSVLHMNKGKVLQNLATWVAIFCVLGLAYQTIGPGKKPSNNMTGPDQAHNQEAVSTTQANDFLTSRGE